MTATGTAPTETMARRFGRGLGWSVGGTIALRVVSVVTSVLMARLIAPDEFGVFAVALTVMMILGTVAEFGLGTDLVRADDLEARAPTVATLGIVLSSVLAVSMALAADGIAAVFRSPESAGVIRLMSISLAVFGISIVPAARLQRDYRQKALFVVNGAGAVSSLAVMTVLATAGVGAYALAWGQIASQAVVVVGLHAATRTSPRLGLHPASARESLAFCLPLAGANLLSWLLLSVDNLVVARLLDPTQLGLYVLAFNVSSWPMSALGQSLRVVALPAFSGLGDEQRNESLVRGSAPVVAVAGFVGVMLACLADPLVRLLYGDTWHEAAVALAGLAVFGGIRVVFDLVATFLIAVGTTTAVLLVQVLWLASMVPAMLLGVHVGGLTGAGWTHVVVAVAIVLPAYLVCLGRVGVSARRLLTPWVMPLVALTPAAVVCWWIGHADAAPLLLLAGGGSAGLLLYALPLARWWTRSVSTLKHVAADGAQPTQNG